MSGKINFSMSFNIGNSNEERQEAFMMYQSAFGAEKISEVMSPEGDLHIVMRLGQITVLIAPGGKVEKNIENAMCCEMMFEQDQDFYHAYNILKEGSMYHNIGFYPWAPIGANVTDKYGVCWWLRI